METELKAKLLKMLREDEEFRYTVAGLIGLGEILRELADLRYRSEQHDRKFNEILGRLDEHDRKFNEILGRLDEHDRKFNEILGRLDEHDRKFNEILGRLDEHDRKFNEVVSELRELHREVSEIRAYVERTSLTLEEEAREVLEYRLHREGIQVKLKPLIKPDLEVNIYGATGDLCVVGEVSTRAGIRVVRALDRKIATLQRRHPELLKPKVIKVLYVLWASEEAIKEAEQRGIWVVKTTSNLTQLKIVEQNSMEA